MDYAGPTAEVTDRRTGEIHEAKVFAGVLAASHVRMFEYRGGVPELVTPDNEKAVRRASRYDHIQVDSHLGTGAWRPTSADAGREVTRPSGHTCPPRTAPTSIGHRRDSSAGLARPGPTPDRSLHKEAA